jgi:Nitroreductase family
LVSPRSGPTSNLRGHEHRTWLPGPVEESLIRRQSVRTFARSAVPLSQVLGAIAAAREAADAVWPPDRHGALTLDMLIAAISVDGLAPGLYTARASGAELLTPDSAYLDILREQYTDAPVLILVGADLNQACRDAGQAGYPATLTRVGTAGYAAWLWAISAGLAGCVYGGTSLQAGGAWRQLDVNLRHLFTVAVGVPAGGGPGAENGSES